MEDGAGSISDNGGNRMSAFDEAAAHDFNGQGSGRDGHEVWLQGK
jgi:hypothetical protein